MPCHSINASHHGQVHSIGCSGLQNGSSLRYHTADSVLTGGCSFIRQHIWIEICMMLAIQGRWMESKWFSTRKICMWICISGLKMDDFEMLSTGSVTGWGGWCSRQRLRQLWSWLWSWLRSVMLESVGRRCTSPFVSPVCLRIICTAIYPRKASGHVVLTKHSQVSFYHSLHHFMPRNLNTPLLLFSDLGTRYLHQILCFLYCSERKPFIGHFGHVQGQAHVGLVQLYTTSLPCHFSKHVEHLHEISCCFKQWDAAITSTICASVASSKGIEACLIHSEGCCSGNSAANIPELTMLCDFTDWADKWLGRPWRLPVMGSDTLVK